MTAKKTGPKLKAGQPTKYREGFCDLIIEVGETGGWICEMAEACDVHRSTFDNWADKHPKFFAALSRAKQKAQAWFEAEGRNGLTTAAGVRFNPQLWKAQMCARHPYEYTERRVLKHTGPSGGPIQTITSTMTAQQAAEAYAATLNDE